jgi:hypothetical protein
VDSPIIASRIAAYPQAKTMPLKKMQDYIVSMYIILSPAEGIKKAPYLSIERNGAQGTSIHLLVSIPWPLIWYNIPAGDTPTPIPCLECPLIVFVIRHKHAVNIPGNCL